MDFNDCDKHILCKCACHTPGACIMHFRECCDRCPKCGALVLDKRQSENNLLKKFST